MGGRVRGRPQIGLACRPRRPAGDEGGQERRDRQHRLAARRYDLSRNVPLCGGEIGPRRAHPLARARGRPMADSRQRAVAGLCRDGAGHGVFRPQRCKPAGEGAGGSSDESHGRPGRDRQLRRLFAVGRSLVRDRRQLARRWRPRRPFRRLTRWLRWRMRAR